MPLRCPDAFGIVDGPFSNSVNDKWVEYLGAKQSFGGNVPVTMLKAGAPENVRAYVRDLIENVADDGGFMLTSGGAIDTANPNNIHALIQADWNTASTS